MKRFFLMILISGMSTVSQAADIQCLSNKYNTYINASLTWYQDLIQLTTEQYPSLEEVGVWFLNSRKNHFELNQVVVQHYLNEDIHKLNTAQPIESWLQLEQIDVKMLASREDKLGELAAKSFNDRQSKPHPKNYELRSALADLLSHPNKIDSALNKYNQSVANAEQIRCQ